MTTVAATAPAQDKAGPHLLSETLQSRLEAAPLRLVELREDLEHANRRMLSLTERRGELSALSITNKIALLVKEQEMGELDAHIEKWRGVAEYCQQAINTATGVVPEFMKIYNVSAGIHTPSAASK